MIPPVKLSFAWSPTRWAHQRGMKAAPMSSASRTATVMPPQTLSRCDQSVFGSVGD